MAVAGAVPPGVNLGGWLVLEDWFFSGTEGQHVASQNNSGQGTCLPPLLWGMEKEPWSSEGLLTKHLLDSLGEAEVLSIFAAHRQSYIDDDDFKKIASSGVRSVRLPLPWSTFADALSPIDAEAYKPGTGIVPDPVYGKQVSFVTVDRAWLAQMLRQAAHHKLKVVLDLHNMPGGSSDGTYNGIWPLTPKFWTASVVAGDKGVMLAEVGHWIAEAFVKWVEGLGQVELSAIEGITLLNEPGHMASVDKSKGKPFMMGEEQAMDWVHKAADVFRRSTLPGKGVKLYVNMVESAFDNFWETVPGWYNQTFSQQERHSWAVFDIHWYTAWGGDKCSGRTVPGGRYLCSQPVEEVRPMLHKCIEDDMAKFARKVDGLRACSEFSLGTFEDATLACRNRDILSMYLQEQLDVFSHYEIEGFFWTWRMPYGPNFESGWSYEHIAIWDVPPQESGL